MKQRIKLIDIQFKHGKSFGTGDLQLNPKNFEWHRNEKEKGDIVIFSESGMNRVDEFNEKNKILFLLEPPSINNISYAKIKHSEFYNKFDLVLTYNKELIKINPKIFKYYAFGGCWIFPKDQLIYLKNKNISIIASSKTKTIGHKLRHSIIAKYKNSIDGVYGNGYKPVQNKIEALKDYRFSIVIENDNSGDFFSEKLIDCFMTGTIPIYYGCNGNINNYFNVNGILEFKNEKEFETLIDNCTEEYYKKNINSVKENFELAKKYTIPEDYIWENYLKNI